MTIKEFSRLCDCTAQTLRYYDSIDLLKPARVDRFTGYRYYDSEQALDYVKIRNLQKAMFSIEEIKDLLTGEDEAIAEAIDVKIAEQKAKLETLIKIQKSYRSEFMKMQDIISKTRNKLNESIGKYDAAGEYGITEEYYRAIIEEMNDQYDQAMEKMKDIDLPDADEKNVFEVTNGAVASPVGDADKYVVFEESGWKHTSEILEKLPELDGDHILYFELDGEKWSYNDFCYVVLKIVQNRNKDNTYTISCTRNRSKDGKNHFWLLKRQA
ncbi:MAG: MerR family transcriptional regulator [Lachnospiraceae bacterium]|nr:MerR family transcriptional regulator [Lachnospiraceae bacterium]